MRKYLAFVVAAMLCACCAGLAACGGSSGSSGSAAAGSAAASSAGGAAASSAASGSASASSAAPAASASTAQGSHVKAYWGTLDSKTGIHIVYDESNESLGSTATVDAQAKGASYYSKKTLRASGVEDTTVTAMIDGVAMNLDEQAKTGVVATTTSSMVADDPVLMDDVCMAMWKCAQLSPSATEKGEMDGVAYDVEVYAQQYGGDDTFYFDDNGNLAYYVAGAFSSGSTEIGETVYKIGGIDANVNEALFDLSGYTIEGK